MSYTKINKLLNYFPTFNSQPSANSGFTLIELMVVFTIATIMAGVGIASFVTYSRSEQVNQTAGNIKLLINQAKFNSLSVVKTATNQSGSQISCGALSLIGYSVSVVLPDKIILTQVCNEITPPDRTIKTLTMPTGVKIISALPANKDCTEILFSSLSANLSGAPCAVKISGINATKTITVDLQGNTSVN